MRAFAAAETSVIMPMVDRMKLHMLMLPKNPGNGTNGS